jgi:hypothetical protein
LLAATPDRLKKFYWEYEQLKQKPTNVYVAFKNKRLRVQRTPLLRQAKSSIIVVEIKGV